MKARVKATGEIVDVREEYDLRNSMVEVFYSNEEDSYEVYEKEELDFDVKEKSFPKESPDYWTRLEHQYAGMAMQGILSNPAFPKHSQEGYYKKNVVYNTYESALLKSIKEAVKVLKENQDER